MVYLCLYDSIKGTKQMLGLLGMLSLGLANDILLPHFTPIGLQDIKAAEKFEVSKWIENVKGLFTVI